MPLPDGDPSQVTDRDIECPMCGYNLRGLATARCPECGFECTWEDLLSPDACVPYDVLEYALRRRLAALLRTLALAMARPAALWRRLQPQHRWRPKRLVILYLICVFPMLVGLAVDWAMVGWRIHSDSLSNRPLMNNMWNGTTQWIGGAPHSEWKASIQKGYGSLQAFLDAEQPLAPSVEFFTRLVQECARGTKCAAILAVWPLLTFATLAAYRISMKRYRLRTSHLVRTVVYSYVPLFWLGLLFSLGILLVAWRAPEILEEHTLPPPMLFYWLLVRPERTTEYAVLWLAMSVLCYSTMLLIVACRHYLRIPRPIAGVVASQVLILLALMAWELLG